MRICLVGGIFGKPAEYRASMTHTPETVLAAGLRERGHVVEERGHSGRHDFGGFDVVHIHHLGAGAVAAASAPERPRLAFTSHSRGQPSGPRRAAMSYVTARADAVVALSESEAKWQRTAFRGVGPRQHVIPNGIDETIFRFEQPASPAPGEPWRLLYVGQLVPLKAVDVLLRAFARLRESHNVELDLVYQVATEEAALRRQAAQLGLTGVRFLGTRAPAELATLYARSHVFVLPSNSEALPSVVSEALLVGRPVVGTSVGAVAEQVGTFGRVVAPRDHAAMADAVAYVVGRYEAYARASAATSRAAAGRYSIGAMVSAHERMYEHLAKSGSAARGIAGRVGDAGARAILRLRRTG